MWNICSYLWDMKQTHSTPSKPNRPTQTQWTYTNLGNGTQCMSNDEYSFIIG